MGSILSVFVSLVTALNSAAQFAPSTADAWDVNQGTTVILSTDLEPTLDPRDMFGGLFGQSENGHVVFADGSPEGTVSIIQWRVKKQLGIKSFSLFAYDDPGTRDHGIGTFRLKAKTYGSQTFDVLLFEYTPSHPYTYEDAGNHLLISANVKPVLAQEFKAEFTTWNGQSGASANGPRIVELDGFTDIIGVRPDIRTSETEVSWLSAPDVIYQVEYREDVSSSTWQKLGDLLTGTGSILKVTDKVPAGNAERFYRVVPVE